jgi:protein TonB
MMTDVVVRGVKDSIDKSNPRYNDTALDSGDDTVFNVVEQMPSFPGGNGELMKYLSRKLMFPPVAREMSVEADITVKFTVDKTGFVRAPQVVSVSSRSPLVTDEVAKAAKDGDEAAIETSRNYADAVEALKEEAIHVVRTMPRWEPGRQNGKRIDTSYTLPINFKLN